MREDFDGIEIVDVQEDTRPWWKDRYITLEPGWWIVPLATGVIGLPALLLALNSPQ